MPPPVTFSCPLCEERGRDVAIRGELDTTAPWTTLANLAGCPHADAFGDLHRLTAAEEQRLIEAALDALDQVGHAATAVARARPATRRTESLRRANRVAMWILILAVALWTGLANTRDMLGYGGAPPWDTWLDVLEGWGAWLTNVVVWSVIVIGVAWCIDDRLSRPRPRLDRRA